MMMWAYRCLQDYLAEREAGQVNVVIDRAREAVAGMSDV